MDNVQTPLMNLDCPPAVTGFVLRILGTFDCQVNGRPLRPLRSRRGEWLLALLAMRSGREVERPWIASLLWPDSADGLGNLRRTLTDLRDALGAHEFRLQSTTPHTVCLDLTGDAFADVVAFDRASASPNPEAMETAVSLYRGPLLEDCSEEWVVLERERRTQIYLQMLEALAGRASQENSPALAVRYLRRIVLADPLQEAAQRRLMSLLAESGDFAAMSQVYHNLRRLLHREMSAEPDPQTSALYQALKTENRRKSESILLSVPGPVAAQEKPSKSDPVTPRYTLPSYLTAFVGRSQERSHVRELLSHDRLVTLTGAGGIGKTRLAVTVAAEVKAQYPDGIYFVGLAPVTSPDRVTRAVGASLGLSERADPLVEEDLIRHVGSRKALIVLDNCEHLAPECARMSELLLSACPSLQILATSRTSLNVQGEMRWRVPSLSLPDTASIDPEAKEFANTLIECDSVRLFVERASRQQPAFRPARRSLATIARICARLDGIPLAIELAAARIQGFSVEQILARLDDAFRFLTRGNEGAVPRQQSLEAAIAWSYRLLSPSEQKLFGRLSVFAGGCTLQQALDICSDPAVDEPGLEARVLGQSLEDLLVQLLDKSLLNYESAAESEGRFYMLETIRRYASERLQESGEVVLWRERHRRWFWALAVEAEDQLYGADQGAWFERLEMDQDNLRNALAWPADSESQLRFARSLWRFWMVRGSITEGRTWLARALTSAEQAAPTERAAALGGAGILALEQGDFAAAQGYLEEQVAINRQLGSKRNLAHSLNNLGRMHMKQSNFTAARALLEESLAIKREMNDLRGIAQSLGNLGIIASEQSDYAASRQLHMECLEMSRQLNDTNSIAWSLGCLGIVAFNEDDQREAGARIVESLTIYAALEDRHSIADCLVWLSNIAVKCRSMQSAALLAGAVEGQFKGMNVALSPDWRQLLDQGMVAARAVLGENAYRTAYEMGRKMNAERSVAYALDLYRTGVPKP